MADLQVDSVATKSLGVAVLSALGVSTKRAMSATLEMRPFGEVSTLTVRYAVHGDEAASAISEVVRCWSVVPQDEAEVAGDPAPASRPQQP
jgi:hypothetical protein